MKFNSVCIYCGSSEGELPEFADCAVQLGKLMAGRELIYGGGNLGLMGEVARSAKSSGAKVTGIMPKFLLQSEWHQNAEGAADQIIIVQDMHERKAMMAEMSDAFIALPGGLGTLDEFVEILTWAQIGLHKKPVVLANIAGYWNPLLDMFAQMEKTGFLHSATKARPIIANDMAQIAQFLNGTL